ncbi:MAG: hypothetical protein IJ391_03860 [Clostridia bacterium]|nr:hypothetical protein [Clostridia bacterium]
MNNTKRALFLSVVSMLLCIVMLAGTTFAWFTDSVESTGNIIKTGELKIDLVHTDADGKSYSFKDPANAEHKIFDYQLWEPGYIQYDKFELVNMGNLHFKYQLSIMSDATVTELADVIDVYYIKEAPASVTRDSFKAENKIGTLASILANGGLLIKGDTNDFEDAINDGTEDTVFTSYIALKMQESAGNDYQDMPLFDGTAGFSVRLDATQYTYEEDSFDKNYDEKSEYPVTSLDELDDLLSSGEDVVLGSDMTFSANETTANSGYAATGVSVKGGVFDGNGNTVTVKDANSTWACAIHTTGGTIKNVKAAGAMRGIFMGSAEADLYIDNVSFDTIYTFNSDGGSKDYGVYISNSTMNGWTSYSNVHKEVVFTNCEFTEGNGYAFLRAYNDTAFKNCHFDADVQFEVQVKSGAVATFENCYYGDTLITAENITTIGLLYNTDASLVEVK